MENFEITIGNESRNCNPKYIEDVISNDYFSKKEFKGLKCVSFSSQMLGGTFGWEQEENKDNFAIIKIPIIKENKLYQYAKVKLAPCQEKSTEIKGEISFESVPPSGRVGYKNPPGSAPI